MTIGTRRVALKRTATFTMRTALAVLAVTVCAMDEAAAYVDPGTGSMILQLFGAAVVGVLFYLRNFRAYLASLFGRRKPQQREALQDPPRE